MVGVHDGHSEGNLMSFIPSVFRVLTGAIVLLGASVFLNIGGDTGSSEALLAMGAMAKEKCITIGEKRICLEDGAKKKNKNDDDDDDDDNDDNSKPAEATKDCKKARCEPGLVVLDKPNKYGACCEAREGLPPPKQQEAEKCKFPGEVGTPPNCTCPPGTEFMGYKGCLPEKADPVGPSPKKVVNECYTFPFVKGEQAHQAPFADKCRDVYKGKLQCDGTFESGRLKCCCSYSQ
jgi:hypothetical protein